MSSHLLTHVGEACNFHTSRYVIYELARGYLTHLIILHNKASDLDRFSDLVQYMKNRGIGGQYAGPTMLGAFVDFLRELESQDLPLTEQQRLALFRAWIAPLIRRRWRDLQLGKVPSSRGDKVQIVNPVGCCESLPSPRTTALNKSTPQREHFSQDLPRTLCGTVGHCKLTLSLERDRTNYLLLLDQLRLQPSPDRETQRRREALQRLTTHDATTNFAAKDCYSCADAIIACETPKEQILFTKNGKHLKPLCAILGKNLLTYKEPSSS